MVARASHHWRWAQVSLMLVGPSRIALKGNLNSSLQHHHSLLLWCSLDMVLWDHIALPWVVLCRFQQHSLQTCQGYLGSGPLTLGPAPTLLSC